MSSAKHEGRLLEQLYISSFTRLINYKRSITSIYITSSLEKNTKSDMHIQNREKVVYGSSGFQVVSRWLTQKASKEWAFPEKLHTHPMEGHWKLLWGGGSLKPKF